RRVRELGRAITSQHFEQTGRPVERLPLFTFGSFAQALYERAATGKRDVSPELQVSLIERAMKQVDLNYFARSSTGSGGDAAPGVVEQIARTINGVRADGIMPSDFARDIELAEKQPENTHYDIVKL